MGLPPGRPILLQARLPALKVALASARASCSAHPTGPDASAVLCDDATDRDVAASGKLTKIARPVIRVAENKVEGKTVREIGEDNLDYAIESGRYGFTLFFDRNCSFAWPCC
jgi:hypothetical protein